MNQPTSLSIGNFDGVHVGHVRLIHRARELVGPKGRVIALAFDPHPISVLRPQRTPERLTSFEQRASLLREVGADEVVKLEPTHEFLAQEPDVFLRSVIGDYHPTHIVEGHDFHFGRHAKGSPSTLRVLGEAWGVHTEIVDPVEVSLSDQLIARASSSLLRTLLAGGRVQDAARVLGRPYSVSGSVTKGDQRGRTIGFPTLNVPGETMFPADGVYAGIAVLPGGRRLEAAVNIGSRPTFAGVERRVEAHIIDTALPFEYGWPVTIEFHAFLRDQVRFAGVEALLAQLKRDVARASQLVEAHQA
jgi:riboflavin kinase/FMN adenylyltransferase